MDTVNTKRKERLGYKETPMGNVVVQCIPNCDTCLIKAGEPLQSSHTGWPRTRAFTTALLCAIGIAAEVARLFKFSFKKVVDIHLGIYVYLCPGRGTRNK